VTYVLGARSLRRLDGVHPALVKVVKSAILVTAQDFSVTEGVRTLAKQREYFTKGKSRTMTSRHLTGHAVDLTPWRAGGFQDLEAPDALAAYRRVAKAMKQCALAAGIDMDWGYDLWGWDMPHFQLNWSAYPA
jgi:peptidoglycan L-alanyl-D-glutamate endopeptidase CwlK